ncbi:hypothetical protein A9261_15140 [Vibrio tasmaniensis]|nr:hypothetical protein A9261_15140 [Vibrio tasmaniensis]
MPTKRIGVVYVDIKADISLTNEAIKAEGWRFRTRTITMAPGAVVPVHSHNDRPEMAMMKHGNVFIYEVGCTKPYRMAEGDVYHNESGLSHWAINESNDYSVMYVTELVKTY